jgi:hypothetical protein
MLIQVIRADGIIFNGMPVNIFLMLAMFLNLFIQNREQKQFINKAELIELIFMPILFL